MTRAAGAGVLASRRVLVVEDEYFLADHMAWALRKLGVEVMGPVPTPDKALVLLRSKPVDAAVLDINWKGETVFPVADLLRGQRVPFVFATGYDAEAVPEVYRDVPRWEKPFRPEDLAEALPALVLKS